MIFIDLKDFFLLINLFGHIAFENLEYFHQSNKPKMQFSFIIWFVLDNFLESILLQLCKGFVIYVFNVILFYFGFFVTHLLILDSFAFAIFEKTEDVWVTARNWFWAIDNFSKCICSPCKIRECFCLIYILSFFFVQN